MRAPPFGLLPGSSAQQSKLASAIDQVGVLHGRCTHLCVMDDVGTRAPPLGACPGVEARTFHFIHSNHQGQSVFVALPIEAGFPKHWEAVAAVP